MDYLDYRNINIGGGNNHYLQYRRRHYITKHMEEDLMKCVIKKGETQVLRVNNEEAQKMVASGDYKFTNKTDWKRSIGRKA